MEPVLAGKGFMKEVAFELEFVGVETWGWGSLYSLINSYPQTQ